MAADSEFRALDERAALRVNLRDAVATLKGLVGDLAQYAAIEDQAVRIEEALLEGDSIGRLHRAAGLVLCAFAERNRPFTGVINGWRITIVPAAGAK